MDPEEIARRIFAAFRVGDLAAIQALVSQRITVHMPGRNRLSGDYSGLGIVMAMVARAATYVDPASVRLLDTQVHEGMIELTAEVSGSSVGDPEDVVRVRQRMGFESDGKIIEVWVDPEDPAAWDRFIGPIK